MSVSENGHKPMPGTVPTPAVSYDAALVQRVFEEVGERLNSRDEADAAAGRRPLSTADRRQLARSEVQRMITEIDVERLEAGRQTLTAPEVESLTTAVINRLFGLARLQDYIDDDQNTDIFVNGPDRVHLRRRDGTVVQGEPVADSVEELIDMIQTEARRGRHEQRWDPAAPELNMQLSSGDRLHAIAWVSTRPSISIRRHNFDLYRLNQLVEFGTINEALFQFLRAAVLARHNLIVAGGTGAGKTTLLRCLINEIPPDQRLVTVEDNLELGVSNFEALHPNYVELEAREANTEGVGEVTMHDLVKSGLRMGPDRVIVGEIRGAEVVPMLLAMSQGNDGSMSTLHADSSEGVFRRIQMYLAMAPERGDWAAANLLTSNAVDLIVHIARLKNNQRVITSIREVTGIEGESSIPASNEVFSPDANGRAVPTNSMSNKMLDRLLQAGFDPRWLQPSQATEWPSGQRGGG
ncbi:MAG: CpaF family protein [Acidimicrobiales bacterium]